MTIRNILFDLDGTLIDSSEGIEASARAAVQAVLPERELPSLKRLIGPPIRQVLCQALAGTSPDVLDEVERRFRRQYDSEGWRHARLYETAEETLRGLAEASLKIFVVTNKPISPTTSIVGLLKLDRYLVDVVAPDSREPAFASKSDALAHMVAKHDLRKATSLFVGDALDDARAAWAVGVRFAAAAYGYGNAHGQQEFPVHFVLRRAGDLLKIVERENES